MAGFLFKYRWIHFQVWQVSFLNMASWTQDNHSRLTSRMSNKGKLLLKFFSFGWVKKHYCSEWQCKSVHQIEIIINVMCVIWWHLGILSCWLKWKIHRSNRKWHSCDQGSVTDSKICEKIVLFIRASS